MSKYNNKSSNNNNDSNTSFSYNVNNQNNDNKTLANQLTDHLTKPKIISIDQ